MTSRPYESEQDLRDMEDLLMQARSLTDDWRYPHLGDLIFQFFMVACHLDPQNHIRLWHADSKLAGYAILGEDPRFEWQVIPGFERGGIEEEAWVWAQTRIAELCKADPQAWVGACVSGSRQDNLQRRAFLEQHGFHEGGEFSEVNMLCSLDTIIPEYPLPAGFHLLSMAEVTNIPERAHAHRDVWLPWTDGNIRDEDYPHFMHLPGYQADLDLVAVALEGTIAAFANTWLDPVNRIGDFGPVGTRPAYRRLGLGRLLMLTGLRRMQEYGMTRACVSTGVHNEPAIRLYESAGFKIVNRYLEYLRPPGELEV